MEVGRVMGATRHEGIFVRGGQGCCVEDNWSAPNTKVVKETRSWMWQISDIGMKVAGATTGSNEGFPAKRGNLVGKGGG